MARVHTNDRSEPPATREIADRLRELDESNGSLYERICALARGNPRMAEALLGAVHDGLEATAEELVARLVQRGDVQLAIAHLRDDRRARASALPVAVVEAFARDGDLTRATAALVGGDGSAVPSAVIQVAAASIPALRGDTERARELLRELVLPAEAEGDRGAGLAMTYLCEERYVRAIAAARRARRAYARSEVRRFTTLVDVAEVIALLESDRLDDARVLARSAAGELRVAGPLEPLGRDVGALFDAALCGRRGELAKYLGLVEPVLASLEQRGDRTPLAIAARYVARACIGLGRLADAERYLRGAAAIGAQPGMAAVLSFADRDRAALDVARGDFDSARERLAQALDRTPGNPYLAIEAWALRLDDDAALPPSCLVHHATRAYAALRGAERALARGEHAAAARSAEVAERWYDAGGLLHETARARIARAEAALQLGDHAGCRAALERGLGLATRQGYRALEVTGWLVTAALADRTGDLDSYREALVRARDAAGPLGDASLARACARLDVAAVPAAEHAAFGAVVDRLRLARPATHTITLGAATFIVTADERADAATLVVDLADGVVVLGDDSRTCPDLTLRLLARLAEAGAAGIAMETLYLEVWRGRQYQPLRHRNTIYVALQRLRTLLRPLVDTDPIERVDDGHYRIAIPVAVRSVRMSSAFAIGGERRVHLTCTARSDNRGNAPSRSTS